MPAHHLFSVFPLFLRARIPLTRRVTRASACRSRSSWLLYCSVRLMACWMVLSLPVREMPWRFSSPPSSRIF
ncbi:hypothetical protein RK59_000100 [Shigella flexneri]|nr:hypothetical protein RK59_000100 [Shigella flexneri]